MPTWLDQARREPELFAKSVELEETLNARREVLGKDRVYLTRYGKPLAEVVIERGAQGTLDLGLDSCDSGYCFT